MVLHSPFPDVFIPDLPFAEYMFEALNRRRNAVAIIDAPSERKVTFGHVSDEAVKCASALTKQGVRKGDVVAVCAHNSPEYVITVLAVAACGATVTTCNPRYTEGEIKHQFQLSEPKFAITTPESYETVKAVSKHVPSLQKIFCFGEIQGVANLRTMLENEDGKNFPRRVEIDPSEDVLFLPFSSGTTGLPKGVMITHRDFISRLTLRRLEPYYRTDCVYSATQMSNIYGLISVFAALHSGTSHVLDVRFDVDKFFTIVEKYKVTQVAAVPPMLIAMAKSPLLDKYDLASISFIRCGAAPLSVEVADFMRRKLRCTIVQGWGLTESSPLVSAQNMRTPITSVGRVTANTKMKVVDPDTGKEVGPYENGELCCKGPQIMKGYLKNPTATAEIIDADGWLHTGDIGYYDDEQRLYIVDRMKQLIKYKEFQVAPAEVEAVLKGHPKIADVAVIGIPDTEAGELVRAYVVKRDPSLVEEEIHNYIQGRLIKNKHIQGGIEFCDAIHKTPSGKILRLVLRDQWKNNARQRSSNLANKL